MATQPLYFNPTLFAARFYTQLRLAVIAKIHILALLAANRRKQMKRPVQEPTLQRLRFVAEPEQPNLRRRAAWASI
jgi:hypothetical protein